MKCIATRKIDALGRLTIPVEICRDLDIGAKTPLNIVIKGDSIILEKHIKGETRREKPVGIVRRLDSLNRIVVPKEMLDEMDIANGDTVIVRLLQRQVFIKNCERFA